jgi:vitamin B12 transporter
MRTEHLFMPTYSSKKTKTRKRNGNSAARLAAAMLGAAVGLGGGAANTFAQGTTLLPETVVTATGTETPSEQVGSAITVISGQKLQEQQIRFVSDALRTVPGVAVNRTSGFGSSTDVRIRGAEANQTLVLIDGIEVNDPALSSQFNFGNLLVTDIDRIEILRGPQSVLYGSDAVGGVVNIITKKGVGEPTVTASGEYGSFKSAQTSAALRAGGKHYSVALSGTYFKTDGISAANEKDGNTEEDANRNKTVHGTLGLRPANNLEINFTGRWQRARVDTDAFGTVATDDESFTNSLEQFGQAEIKLSLLDDRWEHILSGSLFSNTLRSGGGAFGPSSTEGDKRKIAYKTNLSLETSEIAPATHTISFGFENEREEVLSQSSFSTVDRQLDTQSVYGLYQIGLFERLFLSGGGRFDDNEIFDDTTTMRMTAALHVPETGSKLHMSGGTAVKNPTVFELFGFTSTFSGNPDLLPEKSESFDIGIEQTFLDGKVVGDVTYFNNRIDNLIIGFGSTATNQTGTSRIQGVEMTGRAQIIDGLDVTGSYTYMTTSDANGTQLVRRPQHIASVNVNYGFLEKKRANVNVGVRYNGDQKDVAFGPFRRVTLDKYVLLNIAASYKVNEHVEFFARGENLLNDDYEEVFSFGTPGIAAYGGVRVRFQPLKLLTGRK